MKCPHCQNEIDVKPKSGLTATLRELLSFIEGYIGSNDGVAPSFPEMLAAMGCNSKGAVHRLLRQLEDRGHIVRLYHRARAIEVVAA